MGLPGLPGPNIVGGVAVDQTAPPSWAVGEKAQLTLDKNTGALIVALATGAVSMVAVSPIATTQFRSAAVTNTAVSVKASAGQLYGLNLVNLTAAACYVKFFNLAAGSVVVGTTVPTRTFQIPASSSLVIRGNDMPFGFSTAISVLATSVAADTGTQTAATTLPIIDLDYL